MPLVRRCVELLTSLCALTASCARCARLTAQHVSHAVSHVVVTGVAIQLLGALPSAIPIRTRSHVAPSEPCPGVVRLCMHKKQRAAGRVTRGALSRRLIAYVLSVVNRRYLVAPSHVAPRPPFATGTGASVHMIGLPVPTFFH